MKKLRDLLIMKLKLNQDLSRGAIQLKKDEIYEVKEIIQKDYIIKVPMKQKGKFKRVVILNEEGELVE